MRTPTTPTETAIPHEMLVSAVKEALAQLKGTYGLVLLFRDHPDLLIAARLGSPLVIGVGDGEHFVASDASPLAGYTDKIVYLADHQFAIVTADQLRVTHREQGHVRHNVQTLRNGCDRRRPGRLSALHAEGDLRAARVAGEYDARSLERGRRDLGLRRFEPDATAACAASIGSS